MCDPFTVTAAITVGGGAYNYIQGEEQAKAQSKFASKQAAEGARAITADAIQQFSQIGVRREQEADAAAQAIAQITRDAVEAKGTGKASAGAGGVSGGSVEALISDFARQELARVSVAKTNLANTNQQLDQQGKSTAARANDAIFQNQPAPVQRPDVFGALFQIGSSLVGNYMDNSTYSPETQKRTLNSF